MNDTRRLRDILADQCEAKEIRFEELAKKSGTPEQYLDAIMSNMRTRLPAFPYIRMHLVRIAELLDMPPELLLDAYRQEFSEKLSGAADTLPGNRFALPSRTRRYQIGGVIVVVFLFMYLIGRSGFLGRASIILDLPSIDSDPIITSSSTILLTGTVDLGDTLHINGQAVAVDSNGLFSREYSLSPEINIIEFSVKRFLGGSAEITRQVYYSEPIADNHESVGADSIEPAPALAP